MGILNDVKIMLLKGEKGDRGDDGISPVLSETAIDNGYRVTITDAEGTSSFDLHNATSGNYDQLTNKPFFTISGTVATKVLSTSVTESLPTGLNSSNCCPVAIMTKNDRTDYKPNQWITSPMNVGKPSGSYTDLFAPFVVFDDNNGTVDICLPNFAYSEVFVLQATIDYRVVFAIIPPIV